MSHKSRIFLYIVLAVVGAVLFGIFVITVEAKAADPSWFKTGQMLEAKRGAFCLDRNDALYVLSVFSKSGREEALKYIITEDGKAPEKNDAPSCFISIITFEVGKQLASYSHKDQDGTVMHRYLVTVLSDRGFEQIKGTNKLIPHKFEYPLYMLSPVGVGSDI